jgi:hypothetical protein
LTLPISHQHTVELHSFATKIGFATYTPDIRTVLPLLTKSFAAATKQAGGPHKVDETLKQQGKNQLAEAGRVPELSESNHQKGPITHEWLWPTMGNVRGQCDHEGMMRVLIRALGLTVLQGERHHPC